MHDEQEMPIHHTAKVLTVETDDSKGGTENLWQLSILPEISTLSFGSLNSSLTHSRYSASSRVSVARFVLSLYKFC